MSSNGGEDAVDGTIEKKEEDALVESVKKVEISEDSKEVEKKSSAAEPDKALLKSQFVLFSKFGDKASDGETIKLSQSDKWFKQVPINCFLLMTKHLMGRRLNSANLTNGLS